MSTALESANAALRDAVQTRLANTPADDPKMVGYKPAGEQSADPYAEWVPPTYAGSTPAERTLHDALAAVRDRHGKYGPPTEHFARTAALVNAAFGTTFSAADWAIVMVLDKVARQLGPQATDDAAIDIAGYAACHQECRRGT